MKRVDANDIACDDGIPCLRDLIDEAARWDDPPRINGDSELEEGRGRQGNHQTAPPQALTIAEWRARKLHDPDCLMGKWMTTTSRILQVAPTGVGKTTLMLHLGMAAAAGKDFLHLERPPTVQAALCRWRNVATIAPSADHGCSKTTRR